MAFGEDDGVALVDDEDGGKRKAPACLSGVVIAETSVIEGNVDQDGLEVEAMVCQDSVGKAKFLRDSCPWVG